MIVGEIAIGPRSKAKRVVSAGVYPPYTLRDHERLVWRYGRLLRRLDGTPIADALGFFYMVTARKHGP